MRRVVALSLLTLALSAPAAHADDADVLFDPHAVATIDIALPDASRTALDANPDEYQPAGFSVTAGGVTTGPLQVGIRLKGSDAGSFRPLTGKAAFKLKFNHVVSGQKVLGLKKLTLNNMVEDPSMLHETLAYQAFRAAGVPAPRTGYAFVRVNGAAYGVYLDVETMDDVALKSRFPSTGHLYEGGAGADVKPGDSGRFEIDEGDEDDISDLNALIAGAAGGGDFSDRLAPHADLAEMVRMWAVEKYSGQWDGYAGVEGPGVPNNYYLHSDAGGRFSMLPWGTDQTWVYDNAFDEGGRLFLLCRLDPSCEQVYRAELARTADVVAGLDLPAEARRVADVLEPYQDDDTRKETNPAEIGGWVRGTVEYLDGRRAAVDGWLAAPTPPRPLPTDPAPEGDPPGEPGQEPAGPVLAATAPAATTARAGLRLGRVTRTGAVISTRIRVLRRGSVSQRMVMTVRGRRVTACYVSSRRLGTGLHSLRCRLSRSARRRLRAGPVRLAARTRVAGTPLVSSRLVLARCRGC